MSFLTKLLKRDTPKAHFVSFDETGVVRSLPNGKTERVAWSDLREVVIMTTDQGPYVDDVFWLLVGSNGSGCLVPSETVGMKELLPRLQELPEFDNRALIEAMGSTTNARFLCWKQQISAATVHAPDGV
jgi:hypothetical protein